MRTPRASSARMERIALLAVLGLVPASAFAQTRLQWMQPPGSEAVEEFRVYAGTSPDAGQLVYAGVPAAQAGVYAADVQIDALDAGVPVTVWLTAWNPAGESGASNAITLDPQAPPEPPPPSEPPPGPGPGAGCDPLDSDCDGILDDEDSCPDAVNPGQEDSGGLGLGAPPDGIGDACQCGDVSGDGSITLEDSAIITRALRVPPRAVMNRPELCDVGGSVGCTSTDATIVKRSLSTPPRARIAQQCAPARPPAP